MGTIVERHAWCYKYDQEQKDDEFIGPMSDPNTIIFLNGRSIKIPFKYISQDL